MKKGIEFMNVELINMRAIRSAYFHAFSNTPEEDAWKMLELWAKNKGFLKENSNIRIFGRNTYPTENPEPHGYGFFIALTPETKIEKNIFIRIIPGGLYALLRCEGIEKLGECWGNLWKWVNESEYKYIGETKGVNGFELGYEEHLNWYHTFVKKDENKFIFNLMIQLWEE
ncbi:MAG: GyrI-like domain-containing protein [Promethearchaeota archaeon]